MDDDLLKDFAIEQENLAKKLADAENLIERLKEVIVDNELEDELEDIDVTSLEEKICMDGIRHIAELVQSQQYDDKDVKNFDVLYRTLRSIRGKTPSGNSKKKTSKADLLKIVGNIGEKAE